MDPGKYTALPPGLNERIIINSHLILNLAAISLFMVFSAVSPNQGPVQALPQQQTQQATVVTSGDNSGVADYVKGYFSDIPIMNAIAYCESRDRQWSSDGDVFRGAVNHQDVGVMQINEHYHLDTAAEGNYDIYSLAGNVSYARKLYEKFGTAPWNSSKPCWGKYQGDVALNQK